MPAPPTIYVNVSGPPGPTVYVNVSSGPAPVLPAPVVVVNLTLTTPRAPPAPGAGNLLSGGGVAGVVVGCVVFGAVVTAIYIDLRSLRARPRPRSRR